MKISKILLIVFALLSLIPFAVATCDTNSTTCTNVTFVNSALNEQTDNAIFIFFIVGVGLALLAIGFFVKNPALEAGSGIWFLINGVTLVVSTNYATAIFYMLLGIAILFQTIITLKEK